MKIVEFWMWPTLNWSKTKIRQIAQFLVNRAITKSPGPWRDLSFWPRTVILVFLGSLGLVLKVLKCILRSENFHVILGTLVCTIPIQEILENRRFHGKNTVSNITWFRAIFDTCWFHQTAVMSAAIMSRRYIVHMLFCPSCYFVPWYYVRRYYVRRHCCSRDFVRTPCLRTKSAVCRLLSSKFKLQERSHWTDCVWKKLSSKSSWITSNCLQIE